MLSLHSAIQTVVTLVSNILVIGLGDEGKYRNATINHQLKSVIKSNQYRYVELPNETGVHRLDTSYNKCEMSHTFLLIHNVEQYIN